MLQVIQATSVQNVVKPNQATHQYLQSPVDPVTYPHTDRCYISVVVKLSLKFWCLAMVHYRFSDVVVRLSSEIRPLFHSQAVKIAPFTACVQSCYSYNQRKDTDIQRTGIAVMTAFIAPIIDSEFVQACRPPMWTTHMDLLRWKRMSQSTVSLYAATSMTSSSSCSLNSISVSA
jgi:hypothetical protein